MTLIERQKRVSYRRSRDYVYSVRLLRRSDPMVGLSGTPTSSYLGLIIGVFFILMIFAFGLVPSGILVTLGLPNTSTFRLWGGAGCLLGVVVWIAIIAVYQNINRRVTIRLLRSPQAGCSHIHEASDSRSDFPQAECFCAALRSACEVLYEVERGVINGQAKIRLLARLRLNKPIYYGEMLCAVALELNLAADFSMQDAGDVSELVVAGDITVHQLGDVLKKILMEKCSPCSGTILAEDFITYEEEFPLLIIHNDVSKVAV